MGKCILIGVNENCQIGNKIKNRRFSCRKIASIVSATECY